MRYVSMKLTSLWIKFWRSLTHYWSFVALVIWFICCTRHAVTTQSTVTQCCSCYAMVQKHTSFCSSKFIEVIDLLLDLKSPVDITSLRSRFACFQTLLVHAIEVRISSCFLVPTPFVLIQDLWWYFKSLCSIVLLWEGVNRRLHEIWKKGWEENLA